MTPDATDQVTDDEAAATLAAIIRTGASGRLTHEEACFIATLSADYLVDQLILAGYVVARRRDRPPALPLFPDPVSPGRSDAR